MRLGWRLICLAKKYFFSFNYSMKYYGIILAFFITFEIYIKTLKTCQTKPFMLSAQQSVAWNHNNMDKKIFTFFLYFIAHLYAGAIEMVGLYCFVYNFITPLYFIQMWKVAIAPLPYQKIIPKASNNNQWLNSGTQPDHWKAAQRTG